MNYTTNEVAQKLGITKDTLFYYEREGLLPQIERDVRPGEGLWRGGVILCAGPSGSFGLPDFLLHFAAIS